MFELRTLLEEMELAMGADSFIELCHVTYVYIDVYIYN